MSTKGSKAIVLLCIALIAALVGCGLLGWKLNSMKGEMDTINAALTERSDSLVKTRADFDALSDTQKQTAETLAETEESYAASQAELEETRAALPSKR